MGFGGGDEAGLAEDVGDEGAGEGFGLVGVAVEGGDGGLRELEEVFHGEGSGVALEGDGEGVGGLDRLGGHGHGRLGFGRHGVGLCVSEGCGQEREEEEGLHGV